MGAAVSVQKLVPYWQFYRVRTVLDYGAGNLRNTSYLRALGFDVVVAETPAHLKRIWRRLILERIPAVTSEEICSSRLNVDLVLSNFVLNILEDDKSRAKIIENVFINLKSAGFFLVEVKEKKFMEELKGMSEAELDSEVLPVGFTKLMVLRRRGLLAVLYQKGNGNNKIKNG